MAGEKFLNGQQSHKVVKIGRKSKMFGTPDEVEEAKKEEKKPDNGKNRGPTIRSTAFKNSGYNQGGSSKNVLGGLKKDMSNFSRAQPEAIPDENIKAKSPDVPLPPTADAFPPLPTPTNYASIVKKSARRTAMPTITESSDDDNAIMEPFPDYNERSRHALTLLTGMEPLPPRGTINTRQHLQDPAHRGFGPAPLPYRHSIIGIWISPEVKAQNEQVERREAERKGMSVQEHMEAYRRGFGGA